MSSEPRAIYRFDRFTLDLVRGGLFAEDGSQVALRPKSFDLLRYMVINAGRLVDRDELMQAVWPNVFVTEDSIAQCVKDIRRALGDQTQQLLRTAQRRGYLLDVTASVVGGDAAAAPLPAVAAAAASLPLPTANRPMLVVLPFENLSGDPEQQYFASGLTADLATDLTRFEELHVVTPPDLTQSSAAIPKEASYLVTGSVRRAEGRIRITIRLNDARTGISLWAERFDGSLGELMALQEELVDRLPAHLVIQIEREATRRSRRRPAASLDAYDLCLQGRELQLRRHRTGHARRPRTIRPGHQARFGIRNSLCLAGLYSAARLHLAVGRAERAGGGEARAEIGPSGGRARTRIVAVFGRLAVILMLNYEWDEALETGRAAVQANPCAAESRYDYGDVPAHAGDPAEAEREVRLAHRLNPFRPPHWRVPLARR